ncbi:hypothetical protein HY086_05405 [Candidatus Gottesmanbacteria bacterium]|nr:hypothetical protein [Candidatus Gottesmanbacteria bacterium]
MSFIEKLSTAVDLIIERLPHPQEPDTSYESNAHHAHEALKTGEFLRYLFDIKNRMEEAVMADWWLMMPTGTMR